MKHLQAFLIKLVATMAIFAAILGFIDGISLYQSLISAVVAAIVSYLVADLIVLPALGDAAAAATDFAIALIVIWGLPYLIPTMTLELSAAAILLASAVSGFVDLFFHAFLKRTVLKTEAKPSQ